MQPNWTYFSLVLHSGSFFSLFLKLDFRWLLPSGINCDAAGWVTRISLPSDGLTLKQGITFASSKLALENLTHLTHLNLSQNSLHQSAASFLSLTHLEVLDLSSNLLSRELPVLSLSSSIRVLDLSNNQFTVQEMIDNDELQQEK